MTVNSEVNLQELKENFDASVSKADKIFSSLTGVVYSVSYAASMYDKNHKKQVLHIPTEAQWHHLSFRDACASFAQFLHSLEEDEETVEYALIEERSAKLYLAGALKQQEDLETVVREVQQGQTSLVLVAFIGDSRGEFLSTVQLTVSPLIGAFSSPSYSGLAS